MATQEELRRWQEDGFDGVITCSAGEPARGVFRGIHELYFDEPEYVDIGEDEYPCPHDYLVAAVGGCQVEILKQCLEKSRIEDYDITVDVHSVKGRRETDDEIPQTAGLRISDIRSDITVTVTAEDAGRARRCVEVFEENCPISQSVQAGIELDMDADLREQ
ncbi:MAG: OsmC family protein [Halobacteriota archaeon]